MKTSDMFKKLVEGKLTDGVWLSADECENLSKWAFDIQCENEELILKYAELKAGEK